MQITPVDFAGSIEKAERKIGVEFKDDQRNMREYEFSTADYPNQKRHVMKVRLAISVVAPSSWVVCQEYRFAEGSRDGLEN